jgi:hypothetical protein
MGSMMIDKENEMTKVYIVAGDNGMGNSGHVVLGLYPTEELARKRMAECKGEEAEYIYYDVVEVGPEGADFRVSIGD